MSQLDAGIIVILVGITIAVLSTVGIISFRNLSDEEQKKRSEALSIIGLFLGIATIILGIVYGGFFSFHDKKESSIINTDSIYLMSTIASLLGVALMVVGIVSLVRGSGSESQQDKSVKTGGIVALVAGILLLIIGLVAILYSKNLVPSKIDRMF